MSETSTIVVVDDDPAVRKSLARLFRVAGYRTEAFATARDFLRREPYAGPACLVLDLSLPDLNGLQLQQMLAADGYCMPVIFLTGHGDIPTSVRAMKAGAVDFLSKPCPESALLQAVTEGLAKDQKERKARQEIAEIRQRLAKLTAREYQVLCHVLTGQLNKQIAADLGVVEKTVKVHRSRVMEKMKAQSLAELVHLSDLAGIKASLHDNRAPEFSRRPVEAAAAA